MHCHGRLLKIIYTLLSTPLTFHQSFYHLAVSPNCTVHSNCIHYYAKKQPLTLKSVENDTVEALRMTHNHCLLYDQSQNNISKETKKREQASKPSKPL